MNLLKPLILLSLNPLSNQGHSILLRIKMRLMSKEFVLIPLVIRVIQSIMEIKNIKETLTS